MGTYSCEMKMSMSGGRMRYSKGCRSSEQDRKVQTRAAKASRQSFAAVRDQCLAEGRLFEDPDFPATNTSVYFSTQLPQSFEWKRPTELVAEPRMFIGGASRFDVKQGELGNCWFLASVASLCAAGNRSATNDLLHRVVPKDNSFVDKYAGVVHLNIWQYGKWVDVVIDDRLPCVNGRLMFMHSADPNEFWSALLEKAYAKLNGSYEALSGGCSSEAMEDMTAGVVETFDFKKDVPGNLFKIMQKAYARQSLMACQIDAPPSMIECVQDNGLIVGHAYSLTGVKELNIRGHKVQLVRVRNPWGNQYEWKGAWGDSSPEWKMVSESDRQSMGLSFDDDGEFWMDFQDFTRNFQKMEICNLSPDALTTDDKIRWESVVQEGSWKARVNAGGCRNFLDTFWTNPQFRTQVVDADEDDDDNMGTLIVALMQKERRKKKMQGLDFLTIGFCVYALSDPSSGPLDLNFFKYNKSVARSAFSNVREMCQRFKLPPGHYVIIPTTFQPNEEGDFILRIFSERPCNSTEIDEETGLMDDEEDDEQTIRDLEAKGMISGMFHKISTSHTIHTISLTTFNIDENKLETRKRRMRAKQVTQDDANQEQQVRTMFKNTAGEDLEVDAYELQGILNAQLMKDLSFSGFTLETCRSVVAMMDLDKSGKLGYEEFKTMWQDLRKWKKIFLEFDQDKSGNLNSFEMRQALNSAGIRVSNATFNGIVMRYSDRAGKINFDDFIHCSVRLKTMFATFKDMCDNERPPAKFELDEFIQTTMYS